MATIKKDPIPTEKEFNDALSAHLKAHNAHAKLSAQMSEAVEKAKARFVEKLAALEKEKTETLSIAQRYCEAHESELFLQKRSADTPYGTVGFRATPPALVLCDGKSWDEVIADLKKRLPQFVRVKEEVDKTALVKARDEKAVASRLQGLGLAIQQGENFYFKPKAA